MKLVGAKMSFSLLNDKIISIEKSRIGRRKWKILIFDRFSFFVRETLEYKNFIRNIILEFAKQKETFEELELNRKRNIKINLESSISNRSLNKTTTIKSFPFRS